MVLLADCLFIGRGEGDLLTIMWHGAVDLLQEQCAGALRTRRHSAHMNEARQFTPTSLRT